MPIVAASKLSFAEPLRCDRCGVGILVYGREEPFVVQNGAIYCREHGAEIERSYPAVLAAYWNEVKRRRLQAVDTLESSPVEEAGASSAE